MPLKRNRISFSRIFLIFTSVIYAIIALSGGFLSHTLDLQPQLLIQEHQYWRLLTFIFVPDSFAGFILFFFTFYLVAPKIESAFRKSFFPLFVLLLTLFQSVIFSVLFWNQEIYFRGMAGLSIFLLSFFTMMYPKTRIHILNFIHVKTMYVSMIIVGLWLSTTIINNVFLAKVPLYEPLAFAAFGLIVSFFFYVQLYFVKKLRNRKKYNRIDYFEEEQEYSMAMVQRERKLENETPYKPTVHLVSDPEQNEETLNSILEKIYSAGKDSLSDDEKQFLEDYSKQL